MMTRVFLILWVFFVALTLLASGAGQWVAAPGPSQMTYYAGQSGNYDIFLLDVLRGLSANLTRSPGEDSRPSWSPDGQRMVFYSHRDRRTDLYLMNGDGSGVRRLVESGAPAAFPVWSPDGQWIAFATNQNRTRGIYLIHPDGSGLRRLTDARAALLRWSPDGQRIAFMANCDNNCDLFVINLDDGRVRQLTRNGIFDVFPDWSPDGRQLVFMSNRDVFFEIYILDADCDESGISGCEATRLTHNRDFDGFPAWSPDGRQIMFSSDRDGNFEIYTLETRCIQRPESCEDAVQRLTDRAANDLDPVWSPDGRLIAFISIFDVLIMDADGRNVRLLSRGVLRDQYLTWRPVMTDHVPVNGEDAP